MVAPNGSVEVAKYSTDTATEGKTTEDARYPSSRNRRLLATNRKTAPLSFAVTTVDG